jgi:uncharacterized protein YegJ (DUF2314 family)
MTDTIVSFSSEDERMEFAVDEARRTLRTFFEAYTSPKSNQTAFLLKAMFESGSNTEHIWLADINASVMPLEGTIANETDFPGLSFMQRVTFEPMQITDWMYIEDGYLVGGYTTRVIRAGLTQAERVEYDANAPYRFR